MRPGPSFALGLVVELVRSARYEGLTAGATDHTVADLFELLWNALADLLGTAATAILLRRAAARALRDFPSLNGLTISRLDLEYRYTVPRAWENRAEAAPALRGLVRELRPLLMELTGRIAILHLEKNIVLRESGLISEEERP